MEKKNAPQPMSAKELANLQSKLLLLLIALAIVLTVVRFQRDSDVRAIQNTVMTATVTLVSITVGNPPANLTKNSVIPASSLRQNYTDVALARAKAHIIFSSIYAPSCSSCQILVSNIDRALRDELKGQSRGLGGGLRDIEWQQILINGSTAQATIAATMWSRYAYLDEQGKVQINEPVGKYDTTYTLTNLNGHWLITNQADNISGP